MWTELVSKGVRHLSGLYGAFVIGQEWATQQQIDSIEAGLLAAGSVVWSMLRTFVAKLR